jgi:Cys-tRNA(Pro)/Cys-tRNA(Cys) deacylase
VKSALDVHRALLAAGVDHEMVRLPAPIAGADDLPQALTVDATACVVVRCYRTTGPDGKHALCGVLVRAGDTPDPVSLLDAVGAVSVRPATAAEVNEATDYAAALVSPICLPDDVPLFADAAVGETEVVYAATGEGGVALGIRTHDLLIASHARVTNLTAGPLAAEDRRGWQQAGHDDAAAQVLPLLPGTRRRTG